MQSSIEARLAKLEATTGSNTVLPEWCKNPSDIERPLCEMIAEGHTIADLMKAIDGKTRGLPKSGGER